MGQAHSVTADQGEGTSLIPSSNRCLSPSHTPSVAWAQVPEWGQLSFVLLQGQELTTAQDSVQHHEAFQEQSSGSPPDPAPSCPHESHQLIEGRGSHGDGRELCLLRPRRLQCQRRGAFKGHFWLGRPTRPQIQNKNRNGAPDGLAALAPQNSLVEPGGRAAGGRTGQAIPALPP